MDWIKYIRVTLGLSQQQLADYLSISRSKLALIESGKRSPSVAAIKKMTYLHKTLVDTTAAREAAPKILPTAEETALIVNPLIMREKECKLLAEKAILAKEALNATYQQCLQAFMMIELARISPLADGVVAVLDTHFDLARIEGELEATEEYLNVLQTRKAERDEVPVL